MTRVGAAVLDLLYPPKCPLCELFSAAAPCEACLGEFEPTPDPGGSAGAGPLAYRGSLYAYKGRAAQAVRRLKYDRATALAEGLSRLVADGIVRLGLDPEVVVPVPIHWSRRCVRGFNQAELLCQGLPGLDPHALRRVRATKPQVGLSHAERMLNLKGAFRAAPVVAGKRVLLVDDVLTTGSTARECASALLEAGAAEVGVLALAGE